MNEITRFTASGKTFFFNKKEARNGSDYLSVNAMYGRGRHEKLVLLPSQLLEFSKHLEKAIQEITGFTQTDGSKKERCSKCSSGPARHRTLSSQSGEEWVIYCSDCREILYENVDGAYATIEKEKD